MTRQRQWRLLDNFRRKAFIKTELKRNLLRSITKSQDTPLSHRYVAQFNLVHLPRQASPNKPTNRCVESGRS